MTGRGAGEAGQEGQGWCQGWLGEGRGSLGVSNSAIQRHGCPGRGVGSRQTKGACALGQGAGSKGHEILKTLGQ